MDPVVRKAINDGVVKYEDLKGFECILCDIALSGQPNVKEHLLSKQHRESSARYAIKNLRTCHISILSLLRDSVRNAAEAGEISVTETNDFLCHVCGSLTSGIISLDEHLCSSSHLKKKKAKHPQPTPAVTSSTQALQCTFQSSAVQQAVDQEIVNYTTANDLHCNLCKLSFNGETSLKQHLESKKHKEEGARFAVAFISSAPKSLVEKLPAAVKEAARAAIVTVTDDNQFMCTICQKPLSGVVPLNDHLVGGDHTRKSSVQTIISETSKLAIAGHPKIQPTFTTVSSSSGATPKNLQPQPNLEISRVLAEDIVIETDNRLTPFFCKTCEKPFNSNSTLLDHLKSRKHMNKEKLWKEVRVSSPPAVLHGELSSPVQSQKRYSVISDVRGHVYIFNYTFKGTQEIRRGAEHDPTKLDETFSKMGYKVFIHEDLTAEKTQQKLIHIQREPELNEIDSFIMIFLSHGKDAYTFLGNDQKEIDLDSVRRMFTNRKCPYLRGKPKIFLVNYCRGNQMQMKDIDYDAIEAPEDMVTIHAATEGITARRCISTGTIFVTSFCKVLKKHAKTMDLREMYLELRDEMKQNLGTIPMWEDYVFKTFYFNPV